MPLSVALRLPWPDTDNFVQAAAALSSGSSGFSPSFLFCSSTKHTKRLLDMMKSQELYFTSRTYVGEV